MDNLQSGPLNKLWSCFIYTLSSILAFDLWGSNCSGHNLTISEILFASSVIVSNVHHKSNNCPSFSFFLLHCISVPYNNNWNVILISFLLSLIYAVRPHDYPRIYNILQQCLIYIFWKVKKMNKTPNTQFILF